MGDGAEYESYSSHTEAAYAVADYFAIMGNPGFDEYDETLNLGLDDFYWHEDGAGFVALPYFDLNNYISAYWGDEEANLVSGLTRKEQREFKAALKKAYAHLMEPVLGLGARKESGETSFDAQGRLRWGRRAAGILFRRKDGRFLLVFRSIEVLDPHVWGIPGGRVEPGEDVKKAARLETKEELGKVPPFKIREKDVYRSGDFEYTTFLGEMKEKDAGKWRPELNWENDEWGWFSADHLPEPLHPNVSKVIDLWD
jgi:8-oxo-dGTP pyrophosphatase MutT (NUDIX family)